MDVRIAGTTARLAIEPLERRHAAGWLAALADERVGQFIGGPDVSTLGALESRMDHLLQGPPPDRHESWGNWMLLADGAVIGRIEATIHHGIAEMAYLLGPEYWGQGYATEALRWLIDTLAAGGVTECWATVTPGNEASVRVLHRLGFMPADVPGGVTLWSYDPGDLTFRLPLPGTSGYGGRSPLRAWRNWQTRGI